MALLTIVASATGGSHGTTTSTGRFVIAAAGGSLQPQGPAAATMAELWWLMLALGTGVFVLFALLLWRGLRRDGDDDASPRPSSDEPDTGAGAGRWLLGGGVVLPLVVIGIVFAATIAAMRALPVVAEGGDGLVVEVTGHQWWWEVTYPDHGVVTANEIHVPAGEPVTFRLTSADVIHSFWVPALGGKMDLLPEDTNTLVLRADTPGRYRGDCAEFCGLQHARMGLTVVAEPAADFESWIDAQSRPAASPDGEAAIRGRDTFLGADCVTCHTIAGVATASGDESELGPDLTHLASRLTLAAGVLENTPENLRRWIADPHRFKPGVDMEPADLSDDQLADLVGYLQDLS